MGCKDFVLQERSKGPGKEIARSCWAVSLIYHLFVHCIISTSFASGNDLGSRQYILDDYSALQSSGFLSWRNHTLLWLLFMVEPLLWSLFKVFMLSAKACNCKVFYFMLGNIAQFVSVLEPDNIIRGIEGLDFCDNFEDDRWDIVKS